MVVARRPKGTRLRRTPQVFLGAKPLALAIGSNMDTIRAGSIASEAPATGKVVGLLGRRRGVLAAAAVATTVQEELTG